MYGVYDRGFEFSIGINAAIVHDRAFESAMAKLQGPTEAALTAVEREAAKIFKETAGDASTEPHEARKNESYAQKVLREATEKRTSKKKSKNAEYRSVLHVCSNSNICERLFSGNKLVMSDQRKCMDPSTLETVTVLDENSDLWDARDVQEFALAAKRNGELQDEDFLMAAYESDCSDDEDDDAVVIDLAVDINLANA